MNAVKYSLYLNFKNSFEEEFFEFFHKTKCIVMSCQEHNEFAKIVFSLLTHFVNFNCLDKGGRSQWKKVGNKTNLELVGFHTQKINKKVWF